MLYIFLLKFVFNVDRDQYPTVVFPQFVLHKNGSFACKGEVFRKFKCCYLVYYSVYYSVAILIKSPEIFT